MLACPWFYFIDEAQYPWCVVFISGIGKAGALGTGTSRYDMQCEVNATAGLAGTLLSYGLAEREHEDNSGARLVENVFRYLDPFLLLSRSKHLTQNSLRI